MHYLAQQSGGLTDDMFNEDPFQSNRTRNWFEVDWLLYNFKLSHAFSENTNFTFNFFGLDASRKAVGIRDRRVFLEDFGAERDLIIGDFKNFGLETRFLDKYTFLGKKATYLFGVKYYNAENESIQGPGSSGNDANFNLAFNEFPNYTYQSKYRNPNENIALFGEHILYVTDKISITPGFRLEYISTGSDGYRKRVNTDGAGNPIGFVQSEDNIVRNRSFSLFGIGLSYKLKKGFEIYGNMSQNYRSISFSDVNLVNPSNAIDPNLKDEKGFTADIGVRGNINKIISFDIDAFTVFYNDKIDNYSTTIFPINSPGLLRTNIGDARILGVESLLDFNIKKIVNLPSKFLTNFFINTSFINSEYTSSIVNNVKGKSLVFVPDVNLKTGLKFGYNNFLGSVQYTYISEQFTDAENSFVSDSSNPVVGVIPSYDVLDFSTSYKYKYFKLEAGINNALNNSYFTRRATGYPGPGIIPSAPRTYYVTLEFKI